MYAKLKNSFFHRVELYLASGAILLAVWFVCAALVPYVGSTFFLTAAITVCMACVLAVLPIVFVLDLGFSVYRCIRHEDSSF